MCLASGGNRWKNWTQIVSLHYHIDAQGPIWQGLKKALNVTILQNDSFIAEFIGDSAVTLSASSYDWLKLAKV